MSPLLLASLFWITFMEQLHPRKTMHILLVEDDDVDAEMVIRAFQNQNADYQFTIVNDGIEALKSLRGDATSAPLPKPYIVLLDINMPRMNGFEFLHELRQDSLLKGDIVFILTTSNREEDKFAAYQSHIAGYILKSKTGQDFINIIQLLNSYCATVEFPPRI
jgi:CheY-like chemotaxis protein